MEYINFDSAKAIFVPFNTDKEDSVNQYGFYYTLDLSNSLSDYKSVKIKLTARNIYRLYINNNFILHGPSRTTHGYCRVDEIDITDELLNGVNHIAVEVMEYGGQSSVYKHYSNDCTLENGMFIAEIIADDKVLSATGCDNWKVCKITARAARSERISHCRQSAEIYNINENFHRWKFGESEFLNPIILKEEPIYLPHKALIPKMEEFYFKNLLDFGACQIDKNKKIIIRKMEENSQFYLNLKEYPYDDFKRTVSSNGTVKVEYTKKGLELNPIDTEDFYAFFECGESHLGFINIKVTCEHSGIIDIVHSEVLELDGSPTTLYNTVTRLHVAAGTTEFITMEPALARYMQVIFRGVGSVNLQKLSIIDDSYPDINQSSFLCSNDNINRLYKAAKKTLLLSTKDIFMDCPDRERGGWLCDSFWMARAASLMLSDSLVEKEFLENFLLTPADKMYKGFFPEVYPANKTDYEKTTGITTWSFWLMLEFCEYVRRTGDIQFRDEHKGRIEAFINGSQSFIGKSCLIENLPDLFIDWSLSNTDEHKQPISTAANALYAYMLIELGKTFENSEWIRKGEYMRDVLRSIILNNTDIEFLRYIPDVIEYDENGKLCCKENCYSEAAMYTSLWSGLFSEDEAPLLVNTVKDTMGPLPKYPIDPNIGESQLFIGLCIRLDMLSRQGNIDKMFEDMLTIYEPQLKEGPGTLWEVRKINGNSRCHGFTSHAGVHLMRDILGIGISEWDETRCGKRNITIAPNICGLRWAKGTHLTPDGIVSVSWKYDGSSFLLDISLPKTVSYNITLPREVRILEKDRIKVSVNAY